MVTLMVWEKRWLVLVTDCIDGGGFDDLFWKKHLNEIEYLIKMKNGEASPSLSSPLTRPLISFFLLD